MANINVNTARLESDGKRIIELANQYDTLIENMFDRINSSVKIGWYGAASNSYCNNLVYEKDFFKKLTGNIKSYGNELINEADSIQKRTKKWERE